LDLEASSEVMFSSVGLVLAAVGRPPHRGVDGVFGLVADVEQASDLGQGQADPAPERGRGRCDLVGVGGLVVAGLVVGGFPGGGVGRCGVAALGCESPFFAWCRCARTARKLCAIMASVMCRYQA